MKKVIISIIIVVLVGLGIYYFINSSKSVTLINDQATGTPTKEVSTTTDKVTLENKAVTVLGKSVEGRDINAYHYGAGDTELLFVAGLHGGYDWNTVLLAYKFMDYLKANPNAVSQNIRVTIVPVLNPDGLNKVVGTTTSNFTSANVSSVSAKVTAGRFNANNVDLNRNFDCDWQTSGIWQSKKVSGGSAAFSEPESQALRNYVNLSNPAGVIVWYSAAGGVYSSNCHGGILPETSLMTNIFAKASGYPAYEDFNFYEITGDLVNWLAKENVPAISVLLTNHIDIDWAKNLAGIQAILKHFTK